MSSKEHEEPIADLGDEEEKVLEEEEEVEKPQPKQVDEEKLLELLQGRFDAEEDKGGAIAPLPECEHAKANIRKSQLAVNLKTINRAMQILKAPCADPECSDPQKENWVCCRCLSVGCSRYVNEHMAIHAVMEGHLIAMSLGDLQVWCYGCNSYIEGPTTKAFRAAIYLVKHGADAAKSL